METDNKKKRKKLKTRNLGKRFTMIALSALLIFSTVFNSYDMNVSASESDMWENILIGIVNDGSYVAGAVAGGAIGSAISPGTGTVVGSIVGGNVAKGALNNVLDWYINASETGTREHGGSGKSIAYQYNKGVSTSQNTTNYNTTKNMSLYNETKTWNNTTNNYDYTYNWYNPITNTYNTTNNYTYNATYNTYNYVTYDVDYTTNYYIQDNRTYVSYYIVNENNETGEEEETYVEMYYELPDGRNSLYLTVDDIKGQYFPSNYSKYVSVAEDDGTTLGLWHLDGDLKDSSYHGNTAGSAYNNVYTDGLYANGKKFSDSENDFLELKLDKIDLPDSWTLEWCEYVSDVNYSYDSYPEPLPNYDNSYNRKESSEYSRYYDDVTYDLNYDISFDGYLLLGGFDTLYQLTPNSFVPYALTCDNGVYSFYANGFLVESIDASDYYFKRMYKDEKLGGEDGYTSSGSYSFDEFSGFDFSDGGIKVGSDFIRFSGCSTLLSYRGEKHVKGLGAYLKDVYTGFYSYPVYNFQVKAHSNAIIDEVRLSSGVLYSGSTYIPSSQPYTTNTVLAVPSNPQKHEIAFKTNTDISSVRFGGARPTYPTNGYVYVSLDADNKVESIQQYQEDGWYEIEASLYIGTDWVSFKEVNMEYLGIDGVGDTDDSGGDTGDDTGGDSDDTGGDSSGGGVSAILEGIGKFFDTLLTLVGKIIGMLSDFVNSVLTLFESFTVFTDGFSGFLTGAFGFIPQEAINVIVTGITLLVILAIIKFLK